MTPSEGDGTGPRGGRAAEEGLRLGPPGLVRDESREARPEEEGLRERKDSSSGFEVAAVEGGRVPEEERGGNGLLTIPDAGRRGVAVEVDVQLGSASSETAGDGSA